MKIIGKNQMEILELRNTICEKSLPFDGNLNPQEQIKFT